MAKTRFQDRWLLDPELKPWLMRIPNNRYWARCRFCPSATISLSSMGRQALTSHMKGQKHMKKKKLFLDNGSTSHDANNAAASVAGSFLSPTVEATDDSSSAQEYSNSAVWDPQTHPSEQYQTDTESCHDMNRPNGTGRGSGMDGSVSDIVGDERPAGVMPDTLELFGRYVASILQQLPVTTSYTLQQKFINEAISAKLEYEKEHPSKSPHENVSDIQPHAELPTGNGFQPIIIPPRTFVPEDTLCGTIPSTNKKPRRSKKNKEPPTTATVNEELLLPPSIKQERVDDFEAPEEPMELDNSSFNPSVSKTHERAVCPRVENENHSRLVEEDLPVVKQEIQSDFELVLCNDLNDPGTNDFGPQKLLEALQGGVKKKPPESKQPITCSLCNSSFSSTSDLRLHLRNLHPGIDLVTKTKRSSEEEDSNSTRLTSPSSSANPPHAVTPTPFRSPDGSLQKRPKLTPEPQETYQNSSRQFSE